jgi:membrane-associated phospholipid phosphatase
VGLYLTLTFAVLLFGLGERGVGWVIALHGVAMASTLWLARRTSATTSAALIASLVAIPLLYLEIPHLVQAWGSGYHDATVSGWEHALTGGDPSGTWAGALPWIWFSEAVHLAYASYWLLLFLPPGLLMLARRNEAATTTVLGLLLAGGACFLAFVFFPVQGPRYFGPPEGIPGGPVRSLVLSILEKGSSRGAAFPSAHMAFMTAQTAMAFRLQPRMGWLLLVATAGVGAGAVYGGFHYAVDILAGTAVGLAGAWLAYRLRRLS